MGKEILRTESHHLAAARLERWPLFDQTDEFAADNRVAGLRRLTIAGLVISGLFFGALFTWIYFAELASAALAPGVVKVSSNHKTIQHLEGGIVERILVQDGDQVVAGQTLLQLDGTRARGKLELLRSQKFSALALIARLTVERDDFDRINFPSALTAWTGDQKIDDLMRVQRDIFKARRRSVKTKSHIISQRIRQFEKEIEGLRSQVSADETQLRLIAKELKGTKLLYEKKLIPLNRLLVLQREAAKIEGSRGSNRSQIARVKQEIFRARLEIIDLEESRKKEAVQQLRAASAELNEAEQQIPALEDALHRLNIRAPLAGTIVEMQVHTLGGVIGAGDSLLQIVPKGDTLVIEAHINPIDIDVVHPGLSAQVRLSALSFRNYPPFKARVLWVSADRLIDRQNGQAYFLARLEFSNDQPKTLNEVKLYPGMQTDVIVLTEQSTALEFLLAPIKRNLTRAFREG